MCAGGVGAAGDGHHNDCNARLQCGVGMGGHPPRPLLTCPPPSCPPNLFSHVDARCPRSSLASSPCAHRFKSLASPFPALKAAKTRHCATSIHQSIKPVRTPSLYTYVRSYAHSVAPPGCVRAGVCVVCVVCVCVLCVFVCLCVCVWKKAKGKEAAASGRRGPLAGQQKGVVHPSIHGHHSSVVII